MTTLNIHDLKINDGNDRHRSAAQPLAMLKNGFKRGFSLIELMVAIAIIAILAVVIGGQFSGDGAKATRLLSDMSTIRDAINRAKLELGGVPRVPEVLWQRDAAVAANMFNGIAATRTWNGPYIERQGVDETDARRPITIPTITDAATIHIEREAASAANGGNYTWVYFVRASNIPNPIITEFIKKCAGTDVVADVTFRNSSCRANPGAGGTEFGTVDIKVTDSR